MPHVSKSRLPNETLKEITDSFLFVLTDIKDRESMNKFLSSFLSKTERLMLAKRLAIVYLLDKGFEEAKISQLLHVTQSTISLLKLKFENDQAGYREAINKIKKLGLLQELQKMVLNLSKYAVRAAGGRI